ncbi:MAG: DUF861 domain-containing protein [Maritimibacter sp.]|nr:DUF861 domain-containing protein [Maritimibacter sp.]
MAARFFALDPHGPQGGIQPGSSIDIANVLSGTPNERSASFASLGARFDVGIFVSDAYEERIDDYPVFEVMVILDGHATAESDDGVVTALEPGRVYLLEPGWSGTWRQSEAVRKFTVVFQP